MALTPVQSSIHHLVPQSQGVGLAFMQGAQSSIDNIFYGLGEKFEFSMNAIGWGFEKLAGAALSMVGMGEAASVAGAVEAAPLVAPMTPDATAKNIAQLVDGLPESAMSAVKALHNNTAMTFAMSAPSEGATLGTGAQNGVSAMGNVASQGAFAALR